ncbi:hypothetical protein PVA45_06980 [Entomospira entomophila]|uniref:Uncharacterized protein n=1 Tax=Entomospira entomophila TaxID=2719988 RepID=A0A968GDX1_9SPIO|nr:hypothetical protein [Entomospira entomophilus]NIZ41244.1 hypothetical protein [Entomospira entomophilus]WDI35449.1 hypothetical protein PVA45_06980 [Entomospira entomophilus]
MHLVRKIMIFLSLTLSIGATVSSSTTIYQQLGFPPHWDKIRKDLSKQLIQEAKSSTIPAEITPEDIDNTFEIFFQLQAILDGQNLSEENPISDEESLRYIRELADIWKTMPDGILDTSLNKILISHIFGTGRYQQLKEAGLHDSSTFLGFVIYLSSVVFSLSDYFELFNDSTVFLAEIFSIYDISSEWDPQQFLALAHYVYVFLETFIGGEIFILWLVEAYTPYITDLESMFDKWNIKRPALLDEVISQ